MPRFLDVLFPDRSALHRGNIGLWKCVAVVLSKPPVSPAGHAILWLLVGGIASPAVEAPATAEDPIEAPALLDLRWEAPEGCPDAVEVMAGLRDYLGGRSHRTAVATGRIARTTRGYELELEIDGQRKRVEAMRCDDLGRTAALVLSIALSPEASPEPEPLPEPAPEPKATAVVVAPSTLPAPEIPARRPPPPLRRIRGAVRLESGLNFGILRNFSDFGLAAAVLWPRARFEIGGLFWGPYEVPRAAAGASRVRVLIGSVRATGCWTPRVAQRRRRRTVGPITFPLCGGAELGAVRFDAFSGPNLTRHRLFVAGTITAAIAWPVHPNVALWFGPGGVFPIVRPEFIFDGGAQRYQVGPAAIRTSLGIEAHFP